MIKKIKKLNFRIFKDFDGRALEFKKDNLIFGWNYSGKTTLSDFFQILEGKENPIDNELNFAIELEKGTEIADINESNLNIKVFNKKFVERELGVFDEVNAMEIALGEDKGDVEKLKSISDKMEQEGVSLKKIADKIIDNERINSEIIRSVEKIKSDKARSIKDRCREANFNKNTLQTYIDRDSETLSEDNLKVEYAKINQQMLRDIAEFDASNISISEDKMQKIFAILERKITLQETITEIDGKSDRKEWVRRGMELHQNIKDCLFCGNDISPERLEKLSKSFSGEYTEVKNEVDQHLTYVGDLIQRIKSFTFPTKNDFLSANQDGFSSINIGEMKGKYQQSIEVIKARLLEKEKNITLKIDCSELHPEYIFSIPTLTKLVEKNKRENNEIDKIKQDALDKVKKHYGKEAYKEIEKEKKREVDNSTLNNQKKEKEKEMFALKKKEDEIRKKTSEMANCVSELNKLIESFLGRGEITLGDLDENTKRMWLKRGTINATNLSEGEKTIIAFAYFYLSLKSNINTIDNTIVFIDDPISSFDEDHLSYMAAFIKNDLVNKCKQLFISTHNFIFFDHLRASIVYPSGQSRIGNQFFVENYSDEEGDRCAKLIEMPSMIRDYKSDYLYLFSQIKEFSSSLFSLLFFSTNFVIFPLIFLNQFR